MNDRTTKYDDIRSEVLSRLTPSPKMEVLLKKTVPDLLSALRQLAEDTGMDVEPVLVGSVAKGTYIGEPDIDIFLLFEPDVPKERMEKWGLMAGKKVLSSWEERYAEHPYVRGFLNGFEVDIVPAYRIKNRGRIISSVDRTPLHTEYVISHTDPEQRDEIKLLKAFMKGIGVYGADIRTSGFSGYLCELLVIKFGTFAEVVGAASRWKRGMVLAIDELPSKKFNDPLTFIDPVDLGRNVASALSFASLSRFIYACSEFLRSPSLKFFFPAPLVPLAEDRLREMLHTRGTSFILINFDRPDLIDDILYPQVFRTIRSIRSMLDTEGFSTIDSDYFVSDNTGGPCHILIEPEMSELPLVKKHDGPPVWVSNSADFLRRWRGNCLRGPYIDGGRWYADIKRKHTIPIEFLKEKLTGRLGKNLPEPGYIGPLPDTFSEELRILLTGYLDKRFPWER